MSTFIDRLEQLVGAGQKPTELSRFRRRPPQEVDSFDDEERCLAKEPNQEAVSVTLLPPPRGSHSRKTSRTPTSAPRRLFPMALAPVVRGDGVNDASGGEYATKVDRKTDLDAGNEGSESDDSEEGDEDFDALVARHAELDDAQASTVDHYLTTTMARVNGALDRLFLFGVVIGAFALGFFALSMIFELAYPYDSDPETLYNNSRDRFVYVQRYSDLGLTATNAFTGMIRPMIPLWNSMSNYLVEPVIFIVIEVISELITLGGTTDEFFFLDDAKLPFRGYDCNPNDMDPSKPDDRMHAFTAQAWCGLYNYYETGVTAVETAAAWKRTNPDASFRELREVAGDRFALPFGTARRRSLVGGEAPVFPTGALSELSRIVTFVVGALVELFGVVIDMVMHLAFVLLDDALPALAKIAVALIKVTMEVLFSLVKSGIIGRVLLMAIDFLTVLIVDLALPMLVATFDILFCVFSLFDPSSYKTELRCIRQKCGFDDYLVHGPDTIVFTSAFIVIDAVFKAVTDTWNAPRRMVGLGAVDVNSLFSWYHGAHNDALMRNASSCAACFQCKVCTRSTPIKHAHIPRTELSEPSCCVLCTGS